MMWAARPWTIVALSFGEPAVAAVTFLSRASRLLRFCAPSSTSCCHSLALRIRQRASLKTCPFAKGNLSLGPCELVQNMHLLVERRVQAHISIVTEIRGDSHVFHRLPFPSSAREAVVRAIQLSDTGQTW
eukprot:scaffold2888_cov274-Pinguiococcus_pyrenoidosus.AAC.6